MVAPQEVIGASISVVGTIGSSVSPAIAEGTTKGALDSAGCGEGISRSEDEGWSGEWVAAADERLPSRIIFFIKFH